MTQRLFRREGRNPAVAMETHSSFNFFFSFFLSFFFLTVFKCVKKVNQGSDATGTPVGFSAIATL